MNISSGKENPVICRTFKTKSGYEISETKGISYSRIREIFDGYISEITTTPEKFGLHSLRSGGVPVATNDGISDRLI